ncbi:HAD family hydrolase [Peribacillus faecalis]|nr:HAD family hydrolase [Peribacillus faecalis]
MEKYLNCEEFAIIFDMDGTLFQTDKILETALHDTFEYLRERELWSKKTPIDTYRKIIGVPLPDVWATLLPNQPVTVRNKANEIFHEQLIRHIQEGNGALYPNTIEMLQSLKEKGYELIIASNGQTAYLQAIVSYYRLDCWVTQTFSIERIATMKKSDLVAAIKKKYGITKGAVVGDRLSDIEAAKCNGFLAIGCRFEFAQEDELAQADYVINDLLELLPIVQKA